MSTVGTQSGTDADIESERSGAADAPAGGDSAPEESAELEKDDLFHILQNQRRRRVLKFLQGAEGPVDMRDVAEQVAAWENDTTVGKLSSDQRQRVYIALYQSHLPKLDEKGVLSYNQSRGVVKRRPLADQFDPYLDVASGDDEGDDASDGGVPASTRYYAGATAVGIALTGASWVGVAPTAMTSYLAAFITGMFAFLTVGLMYQERA